MPSRARRAAAWPAVPASRGGRPRTTTLPLGASERSAGADQGAQRLEVGGGLDVGQVRHDAGEPLPLGRRLDEADPLAGEQVAGPGGQRGRPVAAHEDGTLEQRLPHGIPAQPHRPGQAELGRELAAHGGVDEGRVSGRHVRPPRGSP